MFIVLFSCTTAIKEVWIKTDMFYPTASWVCVFQLRSLWFSGYYCLMCVVFVFRLPVEGLLISPLIFLNIETLFSYLYGIGFARWQLFLITRWKPHGDLHDSLFLVVSFIIIPHLLFFWKKTVIQLHNWYMIFNLFWLLAHYRFSWRRIRNTLIIMMMSFKKSMSIKLYW